MKEENGLNSVTAETNKRKNEDEEISPSKRQKKIQKVVRPKNALMKLNELKPGLQYIVESREGPPHNPTFVVSVEVCGQKFTGRGQSKQLAKCAAAQFALDDIGSGDLTTDNIENETTISNQSEGGKKSKESIKEEVQKRIDKIKTEAEDKNPVMVLNELHPGIEFNLVRENVSVPAQRFTMSVEINGETFEGSGPNKKLAKAAVSRVALSSVYNINYNMNSAASQGILPKEYIFPQTTADKISAVIHKKFQEIMVDNTDYAKWKVLAGIVMTSDPEMDNIKIIGISTGTKCINGAHISMNGVCLNDCHAEIIARRCLKNFLYHNLELISTGQKNDSIFISNGGKNISYQLKPDIKFHLYISTSPCGDARIFSPHEEATSKNPVDHHPNRKTRGLLRTKIESGEGTIPVKSEDAIQTWDGIIQGQQRLLTMSCSDKVAAWNVLGIQGALLSYFVEPIYLESIILGSLFHPGHMLRAMWGRFENSLEELPKPYVLNKPKMCCITNPETRQLSKSPNFSVNWIDGFGKPEIINATTGKLENGDVSRLSKRSFFEQFTKLYSKIKSTTVKKGAKVKAPQLYSEAKNSVVHYQTVKEELRKAFKKAGLGPWVQKPVEQDDFDLQ